MSVFAKLPYNDPKQESAWKFAEIVFNLFSYVCSNYRTIRIFYGYV